MSVLLINQPIKSQYRLISRDGRLKGTALGHFTLEKGIVQMLTILLLLLILLIDP